MAKQTTKRASKPNSKPPDGLKSNKSPSALPLPYTESSPTLSPFLDTLDPSHIYLVHIDTHPPSKKRQIYAIAAAMNALIALFLCYRAYFAIPTYLKIGLATLGYDNEEKVDIGRLDTGTLIEVGMRRTFTFLADYALAVYLLPWPVDFFTGTVSPTAWRWTVPFEPREIIVRKSRRWDTSLTKTWLEDSTADAPVYTDKILPAISREWIAKKTGYLMMDKHWDLDYSAMLRAHGLISQDKASFTSFATSIAVYSQERQQWLIWPVHKTDGAESEEEATRSIRAFKDKLTAMGRENLFFRWIELVQYESSQPGDFTAERREVLKSRGKEVFESQGVDFEKFWNDVGGAEGMPGLESSRL